MSRDYGAGQSSLISLALARAVYLVDCIACYRQCCHLRRLNANILGTPRSGLGRSNPGETIWRKVTWSLVGREIIWCREEERKLRLLMFFAWPVSLCLYFMYYDYLIHHHCSTDKSFGHSLLVRIEREPWKKTSNFHNFLVFFFLLSALGDKEPRQSPATRPNIHTRSHVHPNICA